MTQITAAAATTTAPSAFLIEQIEASTLASLGRDILTFLVATVVTIPISRSFKVNPTLSFLIVGCLLGPHNLHLFSNNEADLQLGDFGILFLLFNEGLGLSPDRIVALQKYSKLGLLQIMFSMALFFFGTLIAGPYILTFLEPVIPLDDTLLRPILSSPVQAFCIASAGALSSSAFVLPVLKSKGWEDRKEGVAGLSILLLQDLAVAPLLVLLPILAGSGPQTLAEFGILISKAVFGFGGVLIAGRYALAKVFDYVAEAKSTETFVAAALLVVIGMGQTADHLGLSGSTGAFAAGVLLAGNRFRPQIQADIKPFEGILLGIFFLTAGAELDPVVVLREWPTLLTGIFAFLITKTTVLYASGPALGLTRAESARVAFTLAGGGEFSFVLFKLAQSLDVLPSALDQLLTASVIISMSLTPLLGDLGDVAGNYLESISKTVKPLPWDGLTADEAESIFDEIDVDENGTIEIDELRTALVNLRIPFNAIADIFNAFDSNGDNVISKEEWNDGIEKGLLEEALRGISEEDTASDIELADDAIVVCGFGVMGRSVYGMLRKAGANRKGDIVAFSLDPSRVAAGALSGASVVFGDGARYDLYKAAGVTKPKAVLVTYGSQPRRMDALKRLRAALPQDTCIYVRADNRREYSDLLNAGATDAINESIETTLRFGALLGKCDTPDKSSELRQYMLEEDNATSSASVETIPGYTEDELSDISEETGLTISEIIKLHDIFESIDVYGGDVPIFELRETLMRISETEPVDVDELTRSMELVDEDARGDLSFEEFIRISYLSRTFKNKSY